MRIYLLGNPLLDCDSMPLKLKPYLQKTLPDVEFLEFDPTEDWPDESPLIFIDTVINIKEPKLFTSLDQFAQSDTLNLSMHNFDFYTELRLRQKVGLCKKFYVIGTPYQNTQTELTQEIVDIIKNFKF